MGITLTGKTIASTYTYLLKVSGNSNIGSSIKKISDGDGNEANLYLSTTQTLVGAGSVSVPSFAIFGSTTTGLYSPNANQLGVSIAGSQKALFYSGGLTLTGDISVSGGFKDSNNTFGTSGQVLASTGSGTDWVNLSEISGIDGSGTLNAIPKFTPDGNTIGDSTISDDGTDVTIAANVKLGDSKIINLGSGNDLQIFHNGTDGSIRNFAGDLIVRNASVDKDIIFQADNGNGSVTNYLFLDGSSAQYSSGATQALFTVFPDKSRAAFGDDKELKIYHNVSSYIHNTQGVLNIDSDLGNLNLTSAQADVNIFAASSSSGNVKYLEADGSNHKIKLYFDGNQKLETNLDGIAVTGDVEADEFIGDLRGAVLFIAQAGEALSKGDVVYISGISGNTTVVSKADNDAAGKMPAFGLVNADANLNASCEVVTFGTLSGIDTSSFSEGDELYVSQFPAGLQNTKPAGESRQVQKIAKVTRSHATAGSVKVMGAGRVNDTPNLDNGNIFIGNSSSEVTTVSLSSQITTTGDSRYLQLTGGTLTGGLLLQDNVILDLGTDNDLRIHHTGSAGVISNRTGNLTIQNGANDSDIIFKSDDGSGGLAEYFKLDGSHVRTTFAKDIKLEDNVKILAGTGEDLEIYHDGHSVIRNQTGDLYIDNYQDDGDIIFRSDDGTGSQTPYFQLDGGNGRTNFYVDAQFSDNKKARFGSSADFQIYHTGTESNIYNLTGNLNISNDATDGDIIFKSDDGSGGLATYFALDGGITRTVVYKNFNFQDDVKLEMGTGADLQIYHDGSHSYIKDAGTGELRLRSDGISIQSANGNEYMAFFAGTGGQTVSLYAGNSVKFQTTNTGIDVTGDVIASGDVRVPDGEFLSAGNSNDLTITNTGVHALITNYTGNLTLQNLADDSDIIFKSDDGSGGSAEYFRVDGGGVLTFFSKPIQMADNQKIFAGDAGDLQIYHDGTQSIIQDVGTGQLKILAENTLYLGSATGNETYIKALKYGAVELYYDGSKRIETTSAGIKLPSYGAGYLKTDANGNVSVDTSTIEDTLQTVTDRGSTTTNTMQGTRLGLGGAPHASAALQITTTAQHLRMYNGSELGVMHVLSGGELELWAHGEGETINFRTGSGSGVLAAHIDGIDTTFEGDVITDKVKGSTYPSNSFLDFDYDETAATNTTALTSIARINYIADTNGNDGATSAGHVFYTGTTDIDTATELLVIKNNGDAVLTGIIKTADGSAATPAYNFSSHTGNGMYLEDYDASNDKEQVSVSTDGTRRLRVNEAGVWSDQNFYVAGQFRTFASVWDATAGTSGAGFRFRNTHTDTGGVVALTVSDIGDGVFAGDVTVSGGDVTASNFIAFVSGGSVRIKNSANNTIATFASSLDTTFEGNVLAKNRLTVGQTTVNGAYGLYAAGSFGVGGNASFAGNVSISGDLTVSGTTTTIDTTNLDVKDKNITLNYGSGDTSANADGAGITIQDAVDADNDATILWDKTNSEFDFSHGATFEGSITVGTGNSSIAGDLYFGVNADIFKSSGTLNINASNLALNNAAATKTYLLGTDGGSVQLRHNDVTKLETSTNGIVITGNGYLTSGSFVHFDNGGSNDYAIRKQGTTLEFRTGGSYNFTTGNADFDGTVTATSFSGDGANISNVYKKIYEESWGNTPEGKYIEITLPFISGSGGSKYYYFDVLGYRDIGSMDSQLHYRVYLHNRAAGVDNNDLNADVFAINEASSESFSFGFLDGGASTSKFLIKALEDYSRVCIVAYPSSNVLTSSMISSTETEPSGYTDVTFATTRIKGDLEVGGDVIIDNSSGDPFLKLKTTAQEWVARIDQSDSEKFQIRDVTNSYTSLSIDTSSNASLFGDLTLDATDSRINLKSGAAGTTGGIYWTFNTASTKYARAELVYDNRTTDGLLIDSGYPITMDFSSGNFTVRNNGSDKLTINTSGDATFAGDLHTTPTTTADGRLIMGVASAGSCPTATKVYIRGGTHNGSSSNSLFIFENGNNSTYNGSNALMHVKNAGNRGAKGHSSGSDLLKLSFSDGDALVVDKDGDSTFGGRILATDTGSTGSPTYSFDGNNTTGMMSRSTNNLEFVTAGSSALYFYADQSAQFMDKVGIGVAPTAKLHVQNNVVSEPLALFQTVTAGDASVRIEGIGGESYLEIANTHATTGDSSNSWGIGMDDNTSLSFGWGTNNTLNKSHYLTITNTGNASFAGTITTTSTATGAITLDGGTGVATTGAFVLRQNGDGAGNGIAITSSHATSHRIWKDASGNLNIGSSIDADAFIQDLSGNATFAGNIEATGSRTISAQYDSNHYIRLESNSSGGVLKGTDGGVTTILARSYGDSYFNGGNFGIGTTSPDEKLHVDGTSRFNGDMHFGSSTGGLIYKPIESSVHAERYFLMFDYTNNASYPFLTNRTPNGAVVIKTGTAAGGGENEHFRIKGGNGVVDAYFTNTNLGIGTDSPEFALHLAHNANSGGLNSGVMLEMRSSTATDPAGMRFVSQTGGSTNYMQNLYDGANLKWKHWSGSAYVDKITFSNAGNATFAGNVTLNSRLTFDYGGDHYFEAGTNSLSYKSSGGTSVMTLNASTQAATFGGDVTVNSDNLTLTTAASVPLISAETSHPSGIPIVNLKGAASAQVRYKDENDTIQSRIDLLDGGAFSFVDTTSSTTHLGIDSTGEVKIGKSIHLGSDSAVLTPAQYSMLIEAPSGSETDINMYTHGSSVFNINSNGTAAKIGWGSSQTRSVSIVNTGAGDIQVGIGTTSIQSGINFQVNGVSYYQGRNDTNGTAVFVADSNKGTNQSHIHYGTTGDWYIRPSSNSGKVYIADNASTQIVNVGNITGSYKFNVAGGIYANGASQIASDGYDVLKVSGAGSTSGPTMEIKTSGTTAGASSLDIYQVNTIYGPSAIQFFYGSTSSTAVGSIRAASSSTTYNTSSDYRLKENITDLSNALERVDNLEPKRFNFKNTPDVVVDGFLAHEAQEVVPQAVSGEKDAEIDGKPSYQGIDHSMIVPLLTAAIKELKAQNEELLARIEALENN